MLKGICVNPIRNSNIAIHNLAFNIIKQKQRLGWNMEYVFHHLMIKRLCNIWKFPCFFNSKNKIYDEPLLCNTIVK